MVVKNRKGYRIYAFYLRYWTQVTRLYLLSKAHEIWHTLISGSLPWANEL